MEALRLSRIRTCVITGAAVLAADLLSKEWVWNVLREGPPVVLIPGGFELDFAFNTGSAFGMFAGASWARPVFLCATLGAIAYVVHVVRHFALKSVWPFIGLGLIAGGALGNFHDRLLRVLEVRQPLSSLGFSDWIANAASIGDAIDRGRSSVEIPVHGVVDWIVVYYWPGRAWPSFNVADSALCVGVGLLLLYSSRSPGLDSTQSRG